MFNQFQQTVPSITDYSNLLNHGLLNNRYIIRKGDGFIVSTNNQSQAEPNNPNNLGWKIHISINRPNTTDKTNLDNFKKAWTIFATLALEHNLGCFKVIDISQNKIWTPSKEITIYCAREGDKVDNIQQFLSKLDSELKKADIKPNSEPHSPDCHPMSEFISFRNDRCPDSDWPKTIPSEKRAASEADKAGYISENHAVLSEKTLKNLEKSNTVTDADLNVAFQKAIQEIQQSSNTRIKQETEYAHLDQLLKAQVFYLVKKNLNNDFDVANPSNAEDKFGLKTLSLKLLQSNPFDSRK